MQFCTFLNRCRLRNLHSFMSTNSPHLLLAAGLGTVNILGVAISFKDRPQLLCIVWNQAPKSSCSVSVHLGLLVMWHMTHWVLYFKLLTAKLLTATNHDPVAWCNYCGTAAIVIPASLLIYIILRRGESRNDTIPYTAQGKFRWHAVGTDQDNIGHRGSWQADVDITHPLVCQVIWSGCLIRYIAHR